MFSAKTKSNQSSLTSDIINTTTLTVGDPTQRTINITQNPTSNQGYQAVAMGFGAGDLNQGASSVAIGAMAGNYSQGGSSVAIGLNAGMTFQRANATAVGCQSGYINQSQFATAIGHWSGSIGQGGYAVAVGPYAGYSGQGLDSVSIGNSAGNVNQFNYAIAIGSSAGRTNQGAYSIAVGAYAGQTQQPANSIVLNAGGTVLNGTTTSSCYINPIRNDASANYIVNYSPSSYELTYKQKGYLYYTNTALQSIPDATGTTITFNTFNSSRNIPISGLTYSSGVFTNNSGATLNLSVQGGASYDPFSFTASFTPNGYAQIFIVHSGIGTSRLGVNSIATVNGFYQAISTSTVFTLLNGENFILQTLQTSGSARTLGNNATYWGTHINIMQL